ncbi:MAG: hypothetical protein U0326_16980 [Polyangiales bacterium]
MRAVSLLSLALLLVPARAVAQTSADLASRQELVARAEASRAANDHEHALDFALRAGRIRMTPSLGLMIAQEQRALGQLVESYASALACARSAQADPSAANRASIAATCTSVARALEPALGRVHLRLPADPPAGVTVRVASAEVPEALRDLPRVVMPGAVVVEASAAGRAPFRRTLEVPAGAVVEVAIELPPSVSTRDRGALATPAALDDPRVAAIGSGRGPWIVEGVGVAGLATAGVLYALSGRRAPTATRNATRGASVRRRRSTTTRATATCSSAPTWRSAWARRSSWRGALWYVIARVRASSERTPAVAVTPAAGGLAASGPERRDPATVRRRMTGTEARETDRTQNGQAVLRRPL